ncbi:MAG: hypothetical protein AAB504_01115 [Patescibacteria group bacterium]
MEKINQKLISPTENIVKHYYEKYRRDKRYYLADKILDNLVKKFPGNSELGNIYIKVVTINAFYSAGVLATFKMAQRILKLNIDHKLKIGDTKIVNKIAKLPHVRNFYSFATKYCSFHNCKQFPIYDSFINKMLINYQKQDNFNLINFTNNNLKNYSEFKKILNNFKEHYRLNNLNYRQIDKFLWLYGKEYKKLLKINSEINKKVAIK